MPTPRNVPPGRAGRLWLQNRLATARRAGDLLEQKVRILARAQERFDLLRQRTGVEWEQRSRVAETWLLRSVLLGGQRALQSAVPSEPADVAVTWATAMGLRYPEEASCRFPASSPSAVAADNTALIHAREAYRGAVEAAVRYAVADAAAAALDRESAATRRRLRAVRDRRVPDLETALGRVQLDLDEAEHSEMVRYRWAIGQIAESKGGAL